MVTYLKQVHQSFPYNNFFMLCLAISIILSGNLRAETLHEGLQEILIDGVAAYNRAKYKDALETWEKGLRLLQPPSIDDRLKRADFLSNIGLALFQLGEHLQSIERHEEVLRIAQELRDPHRESQALTNLGIVYFEGREYERALEYYNKALTHYHGLELEDLEAQVLNYIGRVYHKLGDFEEAVQYFNQALTIFESKPPSVESIETLQSLGLVLEAMGEYGKAFEVHEQILGWSREHSYVPGIVSTLSNKGLLYYKLGQYEDGLGDLMLALEWSRKFGMEGSEARILHNIGLGRYFLGHYELAFEEYRKALELIRRNGWQEAEAETFGNIGLTLMHLRKYDLALEFLKQALEKSRQTGERVVEASSLTNIGLVYSMLEEYDKALMWHKNALIIAIQVQEVETLWRVFIQLEDTYGKLQIPGAAIFFGKQAVNLFQSLRENILHLQQTSQSAFIQDKRKVYETLADRLIDEGRLWEAQQVLAMLKEEEYFDFIRRQGGGTDLQTDLALTRKEREYVVRYQALQPRIVMLGTRYRELLHLQKYGDLTPAEQTELQQIKIDLNAIRLAAEVFLRDLEVAFQATPRERDREFPKAELQNWEAFQSTLEALGAGTVALHYLSTENRLRVIVTSGERSQAPLHRDSLIGEADLNRMIFAFRKILQNSHEDPLPQAQALYNLLFGGITEDLKKLEAKTLLVYLDGALRYLPLAALHDGTRYVAEQYGVVLYTPAAKDSLKDRPMGEWRVVGLGVSLSSGNFSALPAVPEELDGIVKEAREDDVRGVLPGITHLDQAFTKEQLSGDLQHEYEVVHLASHFHFGGGTDTDSYLLIGGGEKLTLSEFKGVEFPLRQVELLTLSACETGVGGESRDGREVEGLGALAQRRGAKAVLATLWKVADRSTGQFMQQFYQLRQEKQLTKAEALRRVQALFIRGGELTEENGSDSQRAPGPGMREGSKGTFVPLAGAPYAHPYYWAPFILMGNFL